MHEIEVKILNIDSDGIVKALESIGARKIQDTKLMVQWFRKDGFKEDQDPWFLRIRLNSEGKTEVTWKSRPEKVGIAKKVREINFAADDPGILANFFEAIGLVKYAYQEKFRKSWDYKDWRFDLDQYPNMPAYLEIEGRDEEHIKEAIGLLNLGNHQTSAEGERVLIQKEYNLNWHDMRF
ncbi:MAG: CYTH domain-containing protein [Candidatus Doudnabacteria bacterium]|nr:CYTH domain-containing protein [Candidatus Doudnabacteria bacterium]